ncbi:hypothetical protein D3C81_1520260 [compost metagenome]
MMSAVISFSSVAAVETAVVIFTLLLAASQTAVPPVASATKRSGTYVVPLLETGATVSFLTVPLTEARLLPILRLIVRLALVPVTVPVLASHNTCIPSFSKTTRKGTSTELLSRYGVPAGNVRLLPLT